MIITNFSGRKNVPGISTRKTSPTTTNLAKGINTYKPNDTMDYDQAHLAQNARFDRIGEYKTRNGLKQLMTQPIGYDEVLGGMSAADSELETPCSLPFASPVKEYTLYSIKFRAKKADTKYGVLQITAERAGEVIATTAVDPSEMSDELTEYEAIFNEAPLCHQNEMVTFRFATQAGSDAKFVIDAYQSTWVAANIYEATPGEVTNVFEANINGEKSVLFAFAGSLYRMAEDGTTTLIRELPEGVTKVRFNQDINKIRYADGVESPHLIDPSDSWSDRAIKTIDMETGVDLGIKVANIMDAPADNLVYADAGVDTQLVWTYGYNANWINRIAQYKTTDTLSTTPDTETTIAISNITTSTGGSADDIAPYDTITDGNDTYGIVKSVSSPNVVVTTKEKEAVISSYDYFDRDFRQPFPAIETGDPVTAMFSLGGIVYVMTKRNKYQLFMQTYDNWTQSASLAQNGTFSQESVVTDLNYAYFANGAGIFVFDGSSEESITQNSIQNVYDAIPNKESITLELFNNRLYCFYSSTGHSNDSCLVYNIGLNVWESFDTNTYVCGTSGRQNVSNRFICGHSRIGMLMEMDNSQSPYADMGEPIEFDLETSYQHYGAPAQLKRITKWRPEFGTSKEPYYVKCGYALDFTDDVKYAFSINIKDNTIASGSGVWDEPGDYGVPTVPTRFTTVPQVNGTFRRCQIRYQHHAAYEPVNFKSHTLTVQVQRIR